MGKNPNQYTIEENIILDFSYNKLWRLINIGAIFCNCFQSKEQFADKYAEFHKLVIECSRHNKRGLFGVKNNRHCHTLDSSKIEVIKLDKKIEELAANLPNNKEHGNAKNCFRNWLKWFNKQNICLRDLEESSNEYYVAWVKGDSSFCAVQIWQKIEDKKLTVYQETLFANEYNREYPVSNQNVVKEYLCKVS